MNWLDYYLKFPDAATAAQQLELNTEPSVNIDVIGLISKVDEETQEVVTLEGHHVNVRYLEGVTLPTQWQEFVIDTPKNPVRVWA